ncbi:MAG: hypothetical protein A2806_01060 [Candidatus Terrybacteria bacterium RIFCSPHIGHO2_01_FULL_48_17]|uniref:Uncharacterized protein n=1 Tax=Candidatus Terrybacteria bacterium RIFCSPHIGHO2_01_FULL_48_17 TaxID=1802362 RepID=A0A1G2PK65_9BACT|nr:MAG: hypothetical protein A2806_01060 [Candidatus Terrybacteria bacterium RIFCSPHIGHO2_01_FULL_48_17]OHA51904.1 MAG: hypothetical protein A3A30_01075 [Candidatus Terrybacteria bacterium RIFCSPLOWO2_01_FULL_48_14]
MALIVILGGGVFLFFLLWAIVARETEWLLAALMFGIIAALFGVAFATVANQIQPPPYEPCGEVQIELKDNKAAYVVRGRYDNVFVRFWTKYGYFVEPHEVVASHVEIHEENRNDAVAERYCRDRIRWFALDWSDDKYKLLVPEGSVVTSPDLLR